MSGSIQELRIVPLVRLGDRNGMNERPTLTGQHLAADENLRTRPKLNEQKLGAQRRFRGTGHKDNER